MQPICSVYIDAKLHLASVNIAWNIWLNYEGQRPEFSQNGGYVVGFAEWLRAIDLPTTADFVMLACCRLNLKMHICFLYIFIHHFTSRALWYNFLNSLNDQNITSNQAKSNIITLVRHKKPGLTAKCMIRQKKKSPVGHKNALPPCTSWHCHYQTSPPWEFFFQFYSNILFLRTNREMKMKSYWYMDSKLLFNIIMKIEM